MPYASQPKRQSNSTRAANSNPILFIIFFSKCSQQINVICYVLKNYIAALEDLQQPGTDQIVFQFLPTENKNDLSKQVVFLEVPARFELANNGFADRGLTTWLRYHMK